MNFKQGQKIIFSRIMQLRAAILIIGILVLPVTRGLADESLPWEAPGAAAKSAEPESQPYGIETEWGDVIGPDGTVEKKQRIDIPPKNVPPPTPKLKRARPGEIQSVPGTAAEVEDMLQLEVPRTSAPAIITEPEPEPEKKPEPEPEKPEVKEKPKPKPEPEPEPEVQTSQPQPPVAIPPKIKLANTSSFTLDATEIIYDPESKTLRATYAVYEDSAYTITADEIRMDLSRTLLAAEGRVLISTDKNEDYHFTGDFALMNYYSREGEVRTGAETSWFSMSYSNSFKENPFDYSVTSNVQPLPAAGAPSLGGAADVVFSPRREKDTVHARYLSASAGSGLTFYGLTYNDTRGKPASLPVFTMTNGEWKEETFQVQSLNFFQIPSMDYKWLRLESQYTITDSPHSRTVFEAMDNMFWIKDARRDTREHNFQYLLSKSYLRGDNEFRFYGMRYDNNFSWQAGYNRYWMPGNAGVVRFGLKSEATDSEEYQDDHNNMADLWIHRNYKDFILDCNFEMKKKSIHYSFFSLFEQDITNINSQLTFRKKFAPILNGNAFYDILSNISYKDSESSFNYESKYFNKNIQLSLYGKPFKLPGNGDLNLFAFWKYNSEIYEYNYITESRYSSGDEIANASARFSWDIGDSKIGADYIARRRYGGGSGVWAGYFVLSSSPRWSFRVSTRYLHEITEDENMFAETADLSYHINKKLHLFTSFDLDNRYRGIMLHRITLLANFPSGNLSFNAMKYSFGSGSTYYYAPYQYTLTYYLSR